METLRGKYQKLQSASLSSLPTLPHTHKEGNFRGIRHRLPKARYHNEPQHALCSHLVVRPIKFPEAYLRGHACHCQINRNHSLPASSCQQCEIADEQAVTQQNSSDFAQNLKLHLWDAASREDLRHGNGAEKVSF